MDWKSRILLLVAALGWLWSVVEARKHLQDQFHASCYPGCSCNQTAIECRNLHLSTPTELFRHMLPKIYPDLSDIVVTGNNFGVLPDENLFGGNQRHRRVSLVNLSSNRIKAFGAQTFVGLPRVEYFDLSHNRLESVDDAEPFNYLTSLRRINLENVFGSHISAAARADLLRSIFKNNHSFVDLGVVNLANNALEYLHPNTFCNVKGLMRLTLSGNRLKSFDVASDCLQKLQALDLRNNQFHTVPSAMWTRLGALNSIDLSHNPLRCNCALEEFHKFAVGQVNSFLNQEETTCASPKLIAGQKLFDYNETMCPEGGGNWLWRSFLLMLVAALLTVLYRRRQQVRQFVSECAERAPSIGAPVSFTSGYSRLKEGTSLFSRSSGTREQYVEPEFV